MKISVSYNGSSYVVPCGTGEKPITWLIEEAIKRVQKLNSVDILSNNKQFDSLNVRLQKSHAILTKDDLIKDVLDDKEVVFLVGNEYISNDQSHDELSKSWRTSDKELAIDGCALTTIDLVNCGKGKFQLRITEESRNKVQKARNLINTIVQENQVVYGVTTGFGKFARVIIADDKLKELQENLIRSHAAGVGEALPIERARTLLALRINILAKGYSGISLENLDKMVAVFNSGCVSYVPEKGTVGASGDLSPLSHLALGMLGEGRMWGPKTGWADAATVLSVHNLKRMVLGPKEGIALINGTQLIAALGCEAMERAASICRQADVVAGLSIEVLKGTTKAFNNKIHEARPHKGQQLVASRLRSLLHSEVYKSEVAESHRFCDRVQDAYTLRCCPQVHGVVHDTIEFVRSILSVEVNSATDNPMVFADINETMSGGNFHGEYPAKALDYLAIGVHELANMSERRLERLINPAYSELPAFLVKEGGLNSGFMLAQCTAASLVSENKVLTHPSSVDSLTTSAGTEDHVSMGGFAARKSLTVVEHVEYVLAIELLAACQGLEFLRPLKTTEPLEAVYRLVRSVVRAYDRDRYMAPDIEAAYKLLREENVWKVVQPYIDHYETEMQKSNGKKVNFSQPSSPTGFEYPDLSNDHSPSAKKKK